MTRHYLDTDFDFSELDSILPVPLMDYEAHVCSVNVDGSSIRVRWALEPVLSDGAGEGEPTEQTTSAAGPVQPSPAPLCSAMSGIFTSEPHVCTKFAGHFGKHEDAAIAW